MNAIVNVSQYFAQHCGICLVIMTTEVQLLYIGNRFVIVFLLLSYLPEYKIGPEADMSGSYPPGIISTITGNVEEYRPFWK